MKNAWISLRAVYFSSEMAMRSNFTDSFVMFGIFIQPLLIAMLAFWMLSEKTGDYVIFVVIGSGMTGLWSTLLFISGNSITQERWSGTLELLVGAPTPISFVVFGKIIANVVQSLGSILLCYTIAVLAFGYIPTIHRPGLFAVSLVFSVFSYVCFGLIISTVFVLNPEVQHLQNGLEFPMYILCGFLFPIALLPFWTTPFSYILAPYWAARALHTTSSVWLGYREVALCWGMMALLSVIYVFVARILFRKVLFKARVDATLEVQ